MVIRTGLYAIIHVDLQYKQPSYCQYFRLGQRTKKRHIAALIPRQNEAYLPPYERNLQNDGAGLAMLCALTFSTTEFLRGVLRSSLSGTCRSPETPSLHGNDLHDTFNSLLLSCISFMICSDHQFHDAVIRCQLSKLKRVCNCSALTPWGKRQCVSRIVLVSRSLSCDQHDERRGVFVAVLLVGATACLLAIPQLTR